MLLQVSACSEEPAVAGGDVPLGMPSLVPMVPLVEPDEIQGGGGGSTAFLCVEGLGVTSSASTGFLPRIQDGSFGGGDAGQGGSWDYPRRPKSSLAAKRCAAAVQGSGLALPLMPRDSKPLQGLPLLFHDPCQCRLTWWRGIPPTPPPRLRVWVPIWAGQ